MNAICCVGNALHILSVVAKITASDFQTSDGPTDAFSIPLYPDVTNYNLQCLFSVQKNIVYTNISKEFSFRPANHIPPGFLCVLSGQEVVGAVQQTPLARHHRYLSQGILSSLNHSIYIKHSIQLPEIIVELMFVSIAMCKIKEVGSVRL